MKSTELKQRTFDFAVRIARLVRSLPKDVVERELGRQLLRSGTSVAANYRSAQRGRSKAEFIAKLGIAEEECDETAFWIELLIAIESVPQARVEPLLAEAYEILAIIVSSIRTARRQT